jgi:hypothetical protein
MKVFKRLELVKQTVGQSLTNHRHVLSLALLSVIDSCRRDPIKFNILYYNLSAASGITTTETRPEDFGMIDQYNYGLSTNEQLCHPQENTVDNDVAYSKVLLDLAEQFFNRMVKELEQVCINQLVQEFILGSISSSLLTEESALDSKAILPIQTYSNEKKDPLLGADMVTL